MKIIHTHARVYTKMYTPGLNTIGKYPVIGMHLIEEDEIYAFGMSVHPFGVPVSRDTRQCLDLESYLFAVLSFVTQKDWEGLWMPESKNTLVVAGMNEFLKKLRQGHFNPQFLKEDVRRVMEENSVRWKTPTVQESDLVDLGSGAEDQRLREFLSDDIAKPKLSQKGKKRSFSHRSSSKKEAK